MLFVLSKVIGLVLTPSNTIMLCLLAGLLLLAVRWRRSGIALLAIGAATLGLCGWSPLSQWLMLPLTERFPAWQGSGEPDGIIVLGGAIESNSSLVRKMIEVDASGERIITMLQLARRYPKARIVFTGGSGNLVGDLTAEAPLAGQLLKEFGLDHDRLVLESNSRTTQENALLTKQLVTPKEGERWLLVTSAWHMPRSIGLFRKVGFEVEAYPVDFRSRGWEDAIRGTARLSSGLARTDVAIHEWIGLAMDRLSGRSDSLLPGPRR